MIKKNIRMVAMFVIYESALEDIFLLDDDFYKINAIIDIFVFCSNQKYLICFFWYLDKS